MNATISLLVTPYSNECFPFQSPELYDVYTETSRRVRFIAWFKSSWVKGVPCTAGTTLGPFVSPKSILFVVESEISLSPAVTCLERSVVMLQLMLSKYLTSCTYHCQSDLFLHWQSHHHDDFQLTSSNLKSHCPFDWVFVNPWDCIVNGSSFSSKHLQMKMLPIAPYVLDQLVFDILAVEFSLLVCSIHGYCCYDGSWICSKCSNFQSCLLNESFERRFSWAFRGKPWWRVG